MNLVCNQIIRNEFIKKNTLVFGFMPDGLVEFCFVYYRFLQDLFPSVIPASKTGDFKENFKLQRSFKEYQTTANDLRTL